MSGEDRRPSFVRSRRGAVNIHFFVFLLFLRASLLKVFFIFQCTLVRLFLKKWNAHRQRQSSYQREKKTWRVPRRIFSLKITSANVSVEFRPKESLFPGYLFLFNFCGGFRPLCLSDTFFLFFDFFCFSVFSLDWKKSPSNTGEIKAEPRDKVS